MKKAVLILFFLAVFFEGFAQQGVQFEHKLQWQEVLQKAKAENKYVFVDCFATSCRPCKYMADSVFTRNEVGEYFNNHFISVKVQMDRTVKDDERIKNGYAQAKMIDQEYDIEAYPSFLFLNADGELLYKAVGSYDANTFISKATKAFDPDEQYFFLLEQYNEGKTGPAFLKRLLAAAAGRGDSDMVAKLKALKKPGS